jgi:hypothetical protein
LRSPDQCEATAAISAFTFLGSSASRCSTVVAWRQSSEQQREIRMRLDAVGRRDLDDRVQVHARRRTLYCVAEQPVLATDDEGADRVLATVVVRRRLAELRV